MTQSSGSERRDHRFNIINWTSGLSNVTRLEWDVGRALSRIIDHPWTPTEGPDKVRVRGFIYDVDTGLLT